MGTRLAISIWLFLGGTVVGFMATSGGDPATGFTPVQNPIAGAIGALVIGAVAGLIGRWRGVGREAGWPWVLAGAGIGFGFGAVIGVLLEPRYVHATQVSFIAGISAVAIAGVGLAAAAFLVLGAGPVGVSTDAPRSRVGQLVGVVLGIGFPIAFTAFVASNSSDYFYDPALPTIRIEISGSTMTVDPASVPAGRVNFVVTLRGAACSNASEAARLGVDSSQEFLVVDGADPNTQAVVLGPVGPPSSSVTPPPVPTVAASILYLPGTDATGYPIDGPLVLRPGPITWTCGTTSVTTAAH